MPGGAEGGAGRGGWARWLGEGRGLGEGTRRGSFASRGDDARLLCLCEVASTERRRRRAACTALHAQGIGQPRRQGERAATLGGRCKAQARSMRVPTDTFGLDSSLVSSALHRRRREGSRRVEKWARFLSRSPFSSLMVHLARAHFSSTRAGKKSSSLASVTLLHTGNCGKRSFLLPTICD